MRREGENGSTAESGAWIGEPEAQSGTERGGTQGDRELGLRPGVSSSPGGRQGLEGKPRTQPSGRQGWRCPPPWPSGGKLVPFNCPPQIWGEV